MRIQHTYTYLLLYILLLAVNLIAQSTDPVNKLNEAFQGFKYERVIYMADSILVASAQLDNEDLLEIYRLKAISHYSIGQQPYSELAFKSILHIDSTYILDPTVNAPKILRLFNTIKQTYKPFVIDNQTQTTQVDSIRFMEKDYLTGAARSIIFPGWGHSYLEQENAKWFIAGSAVLIPLSVYFTAASWHYERKYLDEIDAQKIKSRFKTFDTIYQTRNLVLAVYLVYWAYSQYDFFRQATAAEDETHIVVYLAPARQQQFQLGINISF